MNIGITIPMGLQKILNTVQAMDNDSQERILQSASIFSFCEQEAVIVDNIVDKAREKLEQEDVEAGTPQDKVKELCLLWLSASGKAAELILTDGKTIKDAYSAMEDKARKKKDGRHNNCVYMPPEEAIGTVMEYFGMDGDTARQELEHGLMYKIMVAESQKYKPHGMAEKPQPVAETKSDEQGIDLSAFSMEGLL